MTDDAPVYCARCLARITDDRLDETECFRCGTVLGADDVLDETQLRERQQRDAEAWDAARRDGLIT
jgi:hypothetical protein